MVCRREYSRPLIRDTLRVVLPLLKMYYKQELHVWPSTYGDWIVHDEEGRRDSERVHKSVMEDYKRLKRAGLVSFTEGLDESA